MLQLILGRAGSGKTEYVFSSINELVKNGEKNILLITPEQFSFAAEKRLLKMLGESNVNAVENSSFSHLCNEIKRTHGGDALPVLSKGGKAIMMKKAIDAIQDSLVLYNKNCDSSAFINSVIKIYDEMKSCRVSVEDIIDASNNVEKEILSKKLCDISNIIGAYDALIGNQFYDSSNELTRLYEKLLTLTYFKDRVVFIDGFSGFVAQEYKIIEVILKQAKAVYITLCSDSYNNDDKYDLFSYVNSNIKILKDVEKSCDTQFLTPIILNENHRATNDELRLVEQYTFSNISAPELNEPENVSVYSAKNISDECDYVSSEISKLLRQGYQAKDVAVICRDLSAYENQLKFSFNKFNIPYFDDQRQSIDTQPLIIFVNYLLRIAIYSFRSDDIFSLLKTGLCDIDDENVANLENYVFTWAINGSKWKQPFVQSTKGFVEEITDSDQKKIEQLNSDREYVVSKLQKFVNSCKNKSCKDISKSIYYTLLDFKADKKLKLLAKSLNDNGKSALAKEQGRIWDLLMEILNQIAVTSGDEVVTLREYHKLFNLVIMNEDLGVLPVGLDNVQLGSADRMRCDCPKVTFVIGANEGKFPQAVMSAGLLTESDRITLKDNDFKLYSYGDTLNAQEKYFAYMAISSPSEKLFVSYVQGNDKNSESSIVTGIQAIFPNLSKGHYSSKISIDTLETDDNAFEILASRFNKNDVFIKSLKEYFLNNDAYKSRIKAVERLVSDSQLMLADPTLAQKIYGNNMYLSASRIENYYNCAFSYFCKFGLNARPRVKAEMDPMQTGTVIHYVLEQIIKENGSKGLSAMSVPQLKVAINKHLQDFLETKMGNSQQFTARFRYQFMRLSKMLLSVVIRLSQEFAQCDFEPKAFELKIGDESGVDAKVIQLENGCKITIHGAVDRVDVYEENDTKYIRVVDYKSGTKKFCLSDIMYGLNLQMLIYLYTICDSKSEFAGVPSGVLYMHSSRSVLNLDRSMSKLDSENNKNYKMQGLVLNDENHEIAQHMEQDLKGVYIPASENKSNVVTGNVVTLEQMGHIAKKIDNMISQMGNELYCGKIAQNPISAKNHRVPCEYCDYYYVCKNKVEIAPVELEDYTDSQVLSMLKEDSHE